jgi:hypothetical protein
MHHLKFVCCVLLSSTYPFPYPRADSSYLYVLAVRQLSKHRQWVAELQQHQHQQAAFRANDKSARLFAQRNSRLIAEVCAHRTLSRSLPSSSSLHSHELIVDRLSFASHRRFKWDWRGARLPPILTLNQPSHLHRR